VNTTPENTDDLTIPLYTEELSTSKKTSVTGRVQVSTVTRQHESLVDELLAVEHVEIERTPIGRPIQAIPAIREEGDTTIIPVVEETLVVERRLILTEEIRIRRVRDTERYQERVMVRKQEAVVKRLAPESE